MITYFIKLIICSAMFLAFYIFFLEKEKIHRFNRFYLLLSVAMSLVIPAISIQLKQEALAAFSGSYIIVSGSRATAAVADTVNKIQTVTLQSVLLIMYGIVTMAMLIRLIIQVYTLSTKAAKSRSVYYNGLKLILLNQAITSHTFLRNVFINEAEFNNNALCSEILTHEKAHVTQKHTWDVLFIQLVIAVCWFNPPVYFIQKAIQLNHEFLADETVIQTHNNIKDYQLLLLNAAGAGNTIALARSFNYLITKKRMIMMTKSTQAIRAVCKIAALAPLLICTVFLVSTKTIAQVKSAKTPKVQAPFGESIASTPEGASPAMMAKYDSLSKEVVFRPRKGFDSFPEPDRHRLETIFRLMSPQQQKTQRVIFAKNPPPLPACTPTEEQFENWKNPALYGVWVDGKKVTPEKLGKYKASDFGEYTASKLYGGAKANVTYQVQVNLMTKQYYADYYKREVNNKEPIMLVRWNPSGK